MTLEQARKGINAALPLYRCRQIARAIGVGAWMGFTAW